MNQLSSKFMLGAVLAGVAVLVGLNIAIGNRHGDASAAPQEGGKSIPAVDRKLSADVTLTTMGVVIKNTDTVDFGSLTMKLNMTQMGGNDGEAIVGPIPQGKSLFVPYGEFTVGTTRFDFSKTKILTIYIKGDAGKTLFLCPGVKCQPAN